MAQFGNSNVKSVVVSFTWISILLVAIGSSILLSYTWQNIRPGYVGIVFDKANHNVTARQLEPGWAFVNPFTQAIREYPITIRTYSMVQKSNEGQIGGDDSIKIQSSEGQQLNLDVIIQYQVIKEQAADLYKDWGGAPIEQVQDGVIRQYTRAVVPVVASRFGWEEVTASKRGEITQEIRKILEEEFGRRHLQIISFGIREVHLPPSLQTALDLKIQAQQAAEQQQYQLKQAEVKAKQDVTEATGRANALRAQAEGEAGAILTRAKAQAEANTLLAQSVTQQLINYQSVQRWDGKVPLMASGSVPFVDMSGLVGAGGKSRE